VGDVTGAASGAGAAQDVGEVVLAPDQTLANVGNTVAGIAWTRFGQGRPIDGPARRDSEEQQNCGE